MAQRDVFPAQRSAPAGGRGTLCALLRLAASAALLASVASCSLISLKSPEKPLSTRDLNARILTHEYSAHFIATVVQTADQISATTQDPAVRLNALRWKIAASDNSERAASQIAPMMGLLDTWALAVQMQQYLAEGAGRHLFAGQQPLAATLATDLAAQAEDLARRLTARDEFDYDQRFVDGYARAHPLESLEFARASIVDLWTHNTGAQVRLVDSLGTVPEALANAGDLLRMYGDNGPSQLLWRGQLAVQESGLSGKELQTALQRLDERMAALQVIADQTPGLVQGVVSDVRTRFNASWAQILGELHTEGRTLSASVSDERQATVQAVDVERAAVAADAARIADQVIREAGEEARRLVREALFVVIALAVVLLGLPFAAGYLVGRARPRQ
ncbi:MAG: hypothetical protein ACHQDD_09430 [Steroidobacterales bacterium]